MGHINLPEGVPGIIGPMIALPETQVHPNGLAEALLRGPPRWSPVRIADIDRVRAEGADDTASHDTVLIAAAFCMFDRYVVGRGTWAPKDPTAQIEPGSRLAERGYVNYDFSRG